MADKATILTGHVLGTTERATRVRGLIDLIERMDVGAKVKTKPNGDTVITIPAKAGK